MDPVEELQNRFQKLQELNFKPLMSQDDMAKSLTSIGVPIQNSLSTSKQVQDLVDSLLGKADGIAIAAEPFHIPLPRRKPVLETSVKNVVDIVPLEIIVYSKEIQTDTMELASELEPKSTEEDRVEEVVQDTQFITQDLISAPIIQELTQEEKERQLSSEGFLAFFDQSTKIVERALNEEYDIFTDYSLRRDSLIRSDVNTINLLKTFAHDQWTKNRVITSIDWYRTLLYTLGRLTFLNYFWRAMAKILRILMMWMVLFLSGIFICPLVPSLSCIPNPMVISPS
jgi:hypothetical protein